MQKLKYGLTYLARRPDPYAYRGFSYEMASRTSLELIQHAAATHCWVYLPEHLTVLRQIMERHLGRPIGPKTEDDTLAA